MTLTWLGSQLSPQAPGFWLLVSFLASALILSARVYLPARQYRLLWFAHWLLIPYLGMLLGGLSPRLLGLSRIDWPTGMSLGLGLMLAVTALLVLVRATVELSGPTTPPVGASAAAGGWRVAGYLLLHSGFTEFHWVFLRGALWEVFLTRPEPLALPAYWAVWGAALIAAAEISVARPGFVPWLLNLVTLLITSILFFYTHNFWLCWVMHAVVQAIGSPSAPLPRRWAARLQGERPR